MTFVLVQLSEHHLKICFQTFFDLSYYGLLGKTTWRADQVLYAERTNFDSLVLIIFMAIKVIKIKSSYWP